MSLPQPPIDDSHDHHHDDDQSLESLLKRAATESIHRIAFFRALLDATVLVLVDNSVQGSEEDGEMTFTAGNGVNILHWEKQDGESVIPFFTSVEVLQQALDLAEDQPIDSEKQPFIAMPVRVLFEMTQGAHLFLNPKSEHGKEFWPQEVTMLLEKGGGSTR